MISNYTKSVIAKALAFRLLALISITSCVIAFYYSKTTNIGLGGFCLLASQCEEHLVCEYTKCISLNKRPGNLKTIFDRSLKLKHNITRNTWILSGFSNVQYKDKSSFHYVACYKNIAVHDQNWKFVNETPFLVDYMHVAKDGTHFITFNSLIFKTEIDLNLVISSFNNTKEDAKYSRITVDATQVYVLTEFKSPPSKMITILSKNLSFISEVSLGSAKVNNAITTYNQTFYAGLGSDVVTIENNAKIKRLFQTVCKHAIDAIMFDDFGNVAIACEKDKIYLYDSKFDLMKNRSISLDEEVQYMGFDVNNKLAIVTIRNIYVYM